MHYLNVRNRNVFRSNSTRTSIVANENLFCYPDEVLEITVSQHNNLKSGGLLTTFSEFSLVKNQQPLFSNFHRSYFCQIILNSELFRLFSFQICMIGLGKIYLKFSHFRCSKMELP